jgi:hypothetical protein
MALDLNFLISASKVAGIIAFYHSALPQYLLFMPIDKSKETTVNTNQNSLLSGEKRGMQSMRLLRNSCSTSFTDMFLFCFLKYKVCTTLHKYGRSHDKEVERRDSLFPFPAQGTRNVSLSLPTSPYFIL